MSSGNGNGITELPRRRQKGRSAPLPTFTFPDSGFTVEIKRLGPYTMTEIRDAVMKEMPRPDPPKITTAVGDLEGVEIENDADPEYKKALEEWGDQVKTEAAQRFLKLAYSYCVVCDIDEEEWNDKRAGMAAVGVNLPEEPTKEDYIKQVLIASQEDMIALQAFILARSTPTEAAVQRHVESFQRNVPGEEHMEDPNSQVWN